jgi:hypothetical protein
VPLPASAEKKPEAIESLDRLTLEDRVRRLEDIIAAAHLGPTVPVKPRPASTAPLASPITATPTAATAKKDAPAPATPTPTPSRFSFRPAQSWLLVEIYAELRAIFRMYFDPRYHMTWFTRLMSFLIIGAILLSRFFVSAIPLVGGILDMVLYPVLLYVLFKVLSREATRYRMTSPDLPPGLRL